MKKLFLYILFVLPVAFIAGCKKGAYPGAQISPYMAIFDVRNIYKGDSVVLTNENMFGSDKITGVVVSDHSGNNLPEGLLVLQDGRRLGQLRGISVNIGAAAADYVPGDSVIVDIQGGTLNRVDGILQVTGVSATGVTKISSGNAVSVNQVNTGLILANPENYESTLVAVVKGGFDPLPSPGETLAGEKMVNDGFGNLTLHTEAAAAFADSSMPVSANFYGIVFNTEYNTDSLIPQLRLRNYEDITILSSVIEIAPLVISGFMSDVNGGDGNYEYIQLMATRDIDFSVTPYAVVVTNNANASTPTGYPSKGWATGDKRTYKINITEGSVAKGGFCYVGGSTKMINGSGSTDISDANWVRSFDYSSNGGDDFGTATSGLFANSGNASGIAVFDGTTVTVDSRPVDVMFIATGGSLYTAGPPAMGYKITNTDFYDVKNPITLEEQPYYRSGSNTLALSYGTPSNAGYFNMLGGTYDPSLGKWTTARALSLVLLSKESTLIEIEGEGATTIK